MFNGVFFPRIQCSDGFSMSVQARDGCYCEPRNDAGPWSAVEVGFPSEREGLLMEWAEDAERPTETVYGWVPLHIIKAVIALHEGTNEEGQAVLAAIENGGSFLDRFKRES